LRLAKLKLFCFLVLVIALAKKQMMNKALASAWGDNGYLQVGSLYKGYQEIKELRIKNALV